MNDTKSLHYYALNLAYIIQSGLLVKLPDADVKMQGDDIVVTFPSGKRITLKVSE